MQNYNYHTHTFRCGHAQGTDEEYVKAAIKAGYKTLGFSDHAPYKHLPLNWARMSWDKLEDYISSISALKEKYKGQIDIRIGLETEYYPEFLDEKKELKEKVEYLIFGQHFPEPMSRSSYFNVNTDEEIMVYAESVCRGMETGLFTYLRHPDLYMYKQPEFNETCRKAARMIAEKAVETNMPLEVNLNGVMRGKVKFPTGYHYGYPHREFWEIMSEDPVRCLYGVDAHKPASLLNLQAVKDGEEELAGLNLNFISEPFI